MHCDPKIDYFWKKKAPIHPIFSILAALCRCVYMCISMCVTVGVHKPVQTGQPLASEGRDECCIKSYIYNSTSFFPTPSQLTRALLISGWSCSCVGWHHMGEIKLSPIWGCVLKSLCLLGCRGREGEGRDKALWGDVHRFWIENSFPIIILAFTGWEAKPSLDQFHNSLVFTSWLDFCFTNWVWGPLVTE